MATAKSTGIAIDGAELAGIVAEGILYGAFSIFLAVTVYILIYRRRSREKLNLPMLTASLLMMALATAQIIVDTINIFKTFINDKTRLERQFFLQDATQPIFAAKHAVYFTMMLLGDSIVVYRCFIVWSKNYWVIAYAHTTTIWAVRHIESVTIEDETKWGIAVLMLSMSTNIMATCDDALGRTSGYATSISSHRRVLKIVMESGLVNAAYLIAYTTVLVLNNHGLQFVSAISTPLIGIIFTVVIVRAAIGSEHYPTTIPGSSYPLPFTVRNRHDGGGDLLKSPSRRLLSMKNQWG
ncbi:hypothetical protein B0H17DRAFT_957300 [Mycena rosella]|uniref:Uncharacterized protein n=1 Tax=Mycena rosella TaxID=1033263 RepID=A0AAD7CMM5_MYCRO|nr:hypothetical protein B0H17DRAFT_957300 [Mycena rosella]